MQYIGPSVNANRRLQNQGIATLRRGIQRRVKIYKYDPDAAEVENVEETPPPGDRLSHAGSGVAGGALAALGVCGVAALMNPFFGAASIATGATALAVKQRQAEERAAAERLAEEKANAPKPKPALQRWLDEQPVMGPVCGALSAFAMAAVYSLVAQQPLWGVVVVVAATALASSFMENAPAVEESDVKVTTSGSTAIWSIFDRRRTDSRSTGKRAESVLQTSAPTQQGHSGHSEGKQNQLYDVFRHLGSAPKEDEAVTVA